MQRSWLPEGSRPAADAIEHRLVRSWGCSASTGRLAWRQRLSGPDRPWIGASDDIEPHRISAGLRTLSISRSIWGWWRKAAIYAAVAGLFMAAVEPPAPAQHRSYRAKTGSRGRSCSELIPTRDRRQALQLATFRLAEILGTLHYLRELCGANEGQVWREHMRELAASEGTSALRRAKFVESFNRGYRDYSRTYRACTQPALVAIQRFMDQASAISDGLIARNDK